MNAITRTLGWKDHGWVTASRALTLISFYAASPPELGGSHAVSAEATPLRSLRSCVIGWSVPGPCSQRRRTAPHHAGDVRHHDVRRRSAGVESGSGSAAERILGTPRSGLAWHSGAWVGGRFDTETINGFGKWRGRPTDVVTAYAENSSYAAMTGETWSIGTWKGFAGKLNYGLSPLPDSGEGSFESIAAGEQDAVWRKVAQNLKVHDRDDSIVRIGWESNLKDWRWHVTASNAEEFKAAFRRIVNVMRAEAPGLSFEFGVGCGSGLDGASGPTCSIDRALSRRRRS